MAQGYILYRTIDTGMDHTWIMLSILVYRVFTFQKYPVMLSSVCIAKLYVYSQPLCGGVYVMSKDTLSRMVGLEGVDCKFGF